MNDSEKDDQTSEPVAADATFDEPPHEAEPADVAPPPKKSGASASIAWLALFLALLSVAGVGYLYLDKLRAASTTGNTEEALAGLGDRLGEADESLSKLTADVAALGSTDAEATSRIESLGRELADRSELFDSLPSRMSGLERSVASLQGVSIDARNTYLVAEAEYYLQIANAQLQLAGNSYLATLALGQADDRLLQLADPALTDVRRAIAEEKAALEVMERPDIAGATLTLAGLARVVDSLPIRKPSAGADDVAAEADDDASGTERAWNAVSGAFTGLVRHTPPSDDRAPLLTPDAEPLIRSNLSLQLQAARLALLRGEQEIFEQSLDDADVWLDLYFDTDSAQVSSTRETLGELRGNYAAVVPPDISGSLRLLRQFKALAEAQQ